MRFLLFYLLSAIGLAAQATKPVQVFSTNGLLQWPSNFFRTNILAAGGTSLSFDSFGRMTISSISGSGTNTLFQTNGVNIASAGTLNFVSGLTGYVSGVNVFIGNSVAGGGDVTTAQLLVVSNQMIASSNYSFTAIGVTSNKFQTDVSNLQGATNGLAAQILVVSNQLNVASNKFQTDIVNLQGATNGLAAQILVVSNQLNVASNKFNTDVGNLQGATNGLHTRVGNLEGATNGLDALVKTKQQGSAHLTNLSLNPYVQFTNINAFQASNNTITTWLGTGVLTNIVNNSTSWPAGQFGWVGVSNNGDVRIRTVSQGANITITDQGTNLSFAAAGGGATPGGNSGAIQFNETGVFAGTNEFRWDRTNGNLYVVATSAPKISVEKAGATGGTNSITQTGMQHYDPGADPQFVFFTSSGPSGGAAGGFTIYTNRVVPTATNHLDLGSFIFPWRNAYAESVQANDYISLGTNLNSLTKIKAANFNWKPTNTFVFTVTNPTAGQVLKFNSVSYAAGVATVILTNDVDSTGGLATNANQFGASVTLTLKDYPYTTNMTDFATSRVNSIIVSNNSYVFVGAVSNLFTTNATTRLGSSTSNSWIGGRVYVDINKRTNLPSATIWTNLAVFTVPAHSLTNNGDTITADWVGNMLSGTNKFFVGYGSITNVLDLTGLTNGHPLASWNLKLRIIRTASTEQRVFAEWQTSPGFGIQYFYTNRVVTLTETNGIDTLIRLQCSANKFGSITNDFMSVTFEPGPR
jgi:hypothetical protein